MLKVQLPDGKVLEFTRRVRPIDVALEIGPGLAKATIAAEIDGELTGADALLPEEGEVAIRLITKRDPEALEIMRHSCAHIMARAVMRLYDNVQLAFGPNVENGFYYDFATETPFSVDDFEKIEAEMAKIIKEDEPFERVDESKDRALELLSGIGQDLKVEHLKEGLGEEETVSFYRQGEFVDLCRGPHVPSPKMIGAFKLTSVAGAYWKGDADNQQLQRLYGTAWFDKKDLKKYLNQLEEAKKRDHRVLGKKHELFLVDPVVGSGLVLWMPKGAVIRRELENFISEVLFQNDYQQVYTDPIGRIELYKTSGHYPYYSDSQYPPVAIDENEQYLLRPMNCPHHIMIYKARPRSYRELPIRLAEFGSVHRFEQKGELSGMTRVRGFTQDDAHIFCTEEQVAAEFRKCIEMTVHVFEALGLKDYRVRLSFRDPENKEKYIGSDDVWNRAEATLRQVCEDLDMKDIQIDLGEAAFYGPKADFVVRDCIGREWQLGTVQLDYNLPSEERFALEYIGADNKKHRPVMIHRAPFGSFERFTGILIEHYAADFPLWLAPEQARVLTVSDKFEDYAKTVEQRLKAEGIRVASDYRSEKIGSKIRDGRHALVPYLLVIGGREEEADAAGVRSRREGELGAIPIDELIAKMKQEIKDRVV
jgi:threonyl-tRNA synthetase